jgi:hypothetical protein
VCARWLGHKVYTDIVIGVDPDLTVRDTCVLADAVTREIRGHVRTLGEAVVRVGPAFHSIGAHGSQRHLHEHEHVHEEQHRHDHEPGIDLRAPHTHWHTHEPLVHTHPH